MEDEQEKIKTFILEEQPFIEIKLRAYRTRDPETGQGVMFMRISDTHSQIMDEQDKEVGFVSSPIGGGVELICGGDHKYFIRPKQIWNAFVEALGKPELKFSENGR